MIYKTVPVIILCLAMFGCQTLGRDEALVAGSSGTVAAVSNAETEVLGKGPVNIALVMQMSGAGEKAAVAKSIRKGAALALKDLGADQLSLTTYNTDGSLTAFKSATAKLTSQNTSLAILADTTNAVAVYTADKPLAISLIANEDARPSGTFAFLPSQTDSLVLGIEQALLEKPGTVLLFTHDDYPKASIEQIRSRLGDKITLDMVTYTAAETAAQVAKRALGVGAKNTVYAFTGNSIKTELLAKSVRNHRSGDDNFIVVGNSTWKSNLLSNPVFEGTIVVGPDIRNQSLISERFQQEYGSPPDIYSLCGYDLIATAAGIVRSKGPSGLTKQALVNDVGFRGVTGAFRFRLDGSIERLYVVNKLQRGRLVPIQEVAAGF